MVLAVGGNLQLREDGGVLAVHGIGGECGGVWRWPCMAAGSVWHWQLYHMCPGSVWHCVCVLAVRGTVCVLAVRGTGTCSVCVLTVHGTGGWDVCVLAVCDTGSWGCMQAVGSTGIED